MHRKSWSTSHYSPLGWGVVMEEGAASQHQFVGVSRTWTHRWVRRGHTDRQRSVGNSVGRWGSMGYIEHCREADLAGAHTASCLEMGGETVGKQQILESWAQAWNYYKGRESCAWGCPLSLVQECLVLPLKSWHLFFCCCCCCFLNRVFIGMQFTHWKIHPFKE